MSDAHAKNHDYHLVDPSPWPIVGAIKAFREEFDYWITYKKSPVGPDHTPRMPEVINPLMTLVAA